MRLFLAPHNDDEALFGAFTLLKEHPIVIVVTDSHIQWNRGDGITADQRWQETCNAMRVLGCTSVRLGLKDSEFTTTEELKRHLDAYNRATVFDVVYAPALQRGHPHHDLVHLAAHKVFGSRVRDYSTYSRIEPSACKGKPGWTRVDGDHELKAQALACYPSQFARSQHHFDAVKGQPEWLL